MDIGEGGSNGMSDRGIMALANSSISLVSLKLNQQIFSSQRTPTLLLYLKLAAPASILALAKQTLVTLELRYVQLKKQDFLLLCRNCPNMAQLSFYNMQVTDACLVVIATELPMLTKLELSGCYSFTDEGLLVVAENCLRLENLALRGENFQLSEVSLIKFAQNCTELKRINIPDRVSITDAYLYALAMNCPLLERFSVQDSSFISDDGVCAVLAHCWKLREISLGAGVTSKSIFALTKHCPKLRSLQISCGRVSEDLVCTLVTHCTQLGNFELSGDGISDKVLVAVATHCTQLKHLNIAADSNVTEQGVTVVATKCKKLRVLCVSMGLFSESALETFRSQYPHILLAFHVHDDSY